MNRKAGAILSATLTLIIFTLLPLYIPNILPQDWSPMFSNMGFELEKFMSQIATIGVIMAAITLIKGFVEKTSLAYLILAVGSSIVTLIIIMESVGLGNMGSLGISKITLQVEGGINTAVIDMRLFVQLAFVLIILQIVQSILEFIDSRKEANIKQNKNEITISTKVVSAGD